VQNPCRLKSSVVAHRRHKGCRCNQTSARLSGSSPTRLRRFRRIRTHGRRQAARIESHDRADQALKLTNRSRSPNAMLLAEVRARALRSPIPPPRLRLSERIESHIILPEGHWSRGCHRSRECRSGVGVEIATGGEGGGGVPRGGSSGRSGLTRLPPAVMVAAPSVLPPAFTSVA
jgi:hypothetical protein